MVVGTERGTSARHGGACNHRRLHDADTLTHKMPYSRSCSRTHLLPSRGEQSACATPTLQTPRVSTYMPARSVAELLVERRLAIARLIRRRLPFIARGAHRHVRRCRLGRAAGSEHRGGRGHGTRRRHRGAYRTTLPRRRCRHCQIRDTPREEWACDVRSLRSDLPNLDEDSEATVAGCDVEVRCGCAHSSPRRPPRQLTRHRD